MAYYSPRLGPLFDLPARRTDPQPSKEAALALVTSGARGALHARVLRLVELSPGDTSRELAGTDTTLYYQVARRLPELEKRGLVRRGKARPSRGSNRRATTWWPNER